MRFQIPRHWAYLVLVGLLLLAVAGAADSIHNALRDNYHAECDIFGDRFVPKLPADGRETNETDEGNETEGYTPPTPQQRKECRDARLPVTIAHMFTRAALGPGIAIIALTAVFLILAALTAHRR